MSTITIRPFKPSNTPELIKLFRDAVHTINIQHYGPEQVAVWAPEDIDQDKWLKSLAENITLVAELDGEIVGFADMTHEGYLDRLYVHKDYQGRFISFRLFKHIEQAARELDLTKITTNCSITAKIPAERMGFKVIKEQTVVRKGVELINYVMEKELK
jgi:putative acetyltransferase